MHRKARLNPQSKVKSSENKKLSKKCRFCQSETIKKDGKRKTENRGLIQRYKCKECGKRFVVDDGFFRMRNSPKKITCALDLFFKGVSTRKVQEHFQAFYPHNSSHKSIYKWVIKYSEQISKFTDTLQLNVGKELQADEVEYHRRKEHWGTGVEKNWFIDVIDCKTRFMVSSEYFKSRGMKELQTVLKRAKERTGHQVEVVTTDGLMSYPQALRKTFGLKKKGSKIRHKQVNASKGQGFNHKVERMHNSVRQFTQGTRGFHGSVESAKAIMRGYSVYYNFIRKHQALGTTPSELATQLKLTSNNKWKELIFRSIANNHYSKSCL